MKTIMMVLVMVLSTSVFANSGALDGKKYCRTVVTGGMFGQPAGEGQHCISFFRGYASDNADTFFGNPPQSAEYEIQGNEVIFDSSIYTLSDDGLALITVKGSATKGTVLTLKR